MEARAGEKRRDQAPPCTRVEGRLCRGCPGWEAMVSAAGPGGPWQGVTIHCPCIGLSVRLAGEIEPAKCPED